MSAFSPEELSLLRSLVPEGRLMVLRVDADEIAVRKLDQAEYSALKEASATNPDWQALALKRAVVGYAGTAPAGAAQLVRALLEEDPQLGDVLGAQIVAAAGHGAQVSAALGEGRKVTLQVRLSLPGPVWTVEGTRPGEGQWSDIRRAIAKGGADAGALRCFELCVPAPPDLALYPALPTVIGSHLMSTTRRRAGDPSL